ncbi:ferritin-like domain-containing protein [Mycena alexandri]|uniref:Ferritin-like domain-containing protein n=1 Tax=Mycena alexandri TaxID=1745969 RepID=A0AAD6TLY7_9AGAR|nr:ferritin-like domain-containing protein [Mycena alexandri]
MRYSSSLLAAALASPFLVSARPIRTRAASATDALVFQFANVLEQLETTFYQQGIAKFQESDFQAAGFSSALIATQTLTTIQGDEATHTTVIQQALKDNGATPLTCNFDFSKVLTDVPTMAATARAVEYVGVAAYLGAATLLDDPVLLDAAASILTVEARHQTMLNILAGASSIPQAFDIPLTPQEVLSIAGGFITGDCPTGITPTNPLTVTNTAPLQAGDLVTVSAANVSGTDNLFCNMMVGGAPFSINLPLASCNVPQGINGPVAIWITSDQQPLANNVVDRATTQQVAGPAIVFIDSQPEMLGAMVRGSSSGGAGSSTSTTTISPDQASSIIAGAAATATSGSSSSGSGAANGAAAPAAPASTPLPSNFTGTSPDGKVTVNGLTLVPNPNASGSASATDGSSASATDSSSASATDSSSASSTDSAAASSSSSN